MNIHQSTAITPFQFEEQTIGVLSIEGKPWFKAGDIARVLAHRDAEHLTRILDSDEKGTHKMGTLGGKQKIAIISRPGLFRAIAVRRATKGLDPKILASIARFQRWVFHEVLPSIQDTGSYGVQAPQIVPAINYRDPALLLGVFKDMQAQIQEKDEIIGILEPKADAFDSIADTEGLLLLTDAAKTLQLHRDVMLKWMRQHNWIYKRRAGGINVAYETKITAGYLRHKTNVFSRWDGTEVLVTQVMVTPKGLTKLATEFAKRRLALSLPPPDPPPVFQLPWWMD